MKSDPSEVITFVVQNEEHRVLKSQFLAVAKLNEDKKEIRRTVLPQWVTLPVFNKIRHFIEVQNIGIVDGNNTEELQKLLWVADILYMEGFQEALIKQKILNNINSDNCVAFLMESHKKLRNSDKSVSCWYNLLNTSMTFIANNLLQLYPKIQGEFGKLNEKILTEILERTVKNLKKNNYQNKHQVFKIIVQIKGVEDIGKFCQELKQVVTKKKINPQIHANLSWKLSNLMNIDLKKTKVFKFIDYDWRLQAVASPLAKKQLNISLILESRQTDSVSSAGSEFVEDFQMKGQNVSGYNQTRQDMCGANDFQRIGVLYLKLVSKIQQTTFETQVRVTYLNIQEKESIELLEFNQTQLYEIGQKKIEITLYCSLENVYTFVLNYLLESYDFTKINLEYFCFEELALITRFLARDGKQSGALHVVLHILHSKKASEDQVRPLVLGLDYRSQPKHALKSISDLLKMVGFHKLNEELMSPFGSETPLASLIKEEKQPQLVSGQLPPRQNTSQRLQVSQDSKLSEPFFQTQTGLVKGRADSKTRLKKIFQSPKRKIGSSLAQQRQQQKRRIDQQLDIRKFIYVQNSAFSKAFNDVFKGL